MKGQLPKEEIIRLQQSSAPFIQRYEAIMSLGDTAIYSGTYVKCFGYEGILTAGHCAKEIMEHDRFVLVLIESAHRFIVETKHFEHIRIGYDETEGYALSEPDLSFLIIRDQRIKNVIHNKHLGFYDISTCKISEVFPAGEGIPTFNWAIVGNPSEQITIGTILVNGQYDKLIHATSAVIQGILVASDFDEVKEFDYLKLNVLTNTDEHPDSYSGVSGGGIWYQKFVEQGAITTVEPFLAGVACWQSEPMIEKGFNIRKITGHGFQSIYGKVRRALYDKRNAEPKD